MIILRDQKEISDFCGILRKEISNYVKYVYKKRQGKDFESTYNFSHLLIRVLFKGLKQICDFKEISNHIRYVYRKDLKGINRDKKQISDFLAIEKRNLKLFQIILGKDFESM